MSMSIWRVDSGSVKSGIRDVARVIDRTPGVGNGDGRIETAEVDAFLKTRGSPRDDEQAHAATALRSYLAEPGMPLWLDTVFVAGRKPMTAISDWIGRSIMGD